MSNTYISRHLLELEIEDVDERLPVTAAQITYARNQIPSAYVDLAVGRDDRGQAARAHTISRQLERFKTVKIHIRTQGDYDDRNQWPDKDVVIFEGTIANRGTDGHSLSLSLQHWLMDMHYSTALAGFIHPSTPSMLAFAAVRNQLLTGAAGVGAPSSLIASHVPLFKAGINYFSIGQDLWSNCYKEMLCGLTNWKPTKSSGTLNACGQKLEGSNARAQAALSRIEGTSKECSMPFKYGVPLTLKGGAGSAATKALYAAMSKEVMQSYLSTSLWGKLVGHLVNHVWCSVIPMVDRALFVPYCPGLRDVYCKEITVDDYGRSRFQFPLNMALRQVGISSKKSSSTGVWRQASGPNPNLLGMGGCYTPPTAPEEGQFYFLGAPEWLDNVGTVGYSPLRNAGIPKNKPPGSALLPREEDDADIAGNADGDKPDKLAGDAASLYNDYAHAVYLEETLRGRTGVAVGKLRFDISPGSTVRVRSNGDPFIGPAGQLVSELIGQVVKVTYNISAEQPVSQTSYELDHVRTVEENEDDAFSIDAHPLFATKFVGAPLVPELGFGDC